LSTTASFFQYEDISLKLFIGIGDTANYNLLIISGSATPEEIYDRWENIIRKYNSTNGSYEFTSYVDNMKAYASLLSDYNVIKATLIKLCFVVDDEAIKYLKMKGYKNTNNQYPFISG